MKTLKKATRYVRQLIAPFLSEIRPEQTNEDVMMDKAEKQLQILSRRKALGAGGAVEEAPEEINEEEMHNTTETRPEWTRFKTTEGRRIVERMGKRCRDIFSKGVDKCREFFANVQVGEIFSLEEIFSLIESVDKGYCFSNMGISEEMLQYVTHPDQLVCLQQVHHGRLLPRYAAKMAAVQCL